jgi:Spy/CpxP family protein refolding chaperone
MDSTENPKASTPPRHSKKRVFWLLLAVPVALAAGFGAFKAHATAGGFGFGAGDSPEQHKAFMERRLDKALDLVKATFATMFTAMRPVHQQHKQLHDQLMSAFAADTVDPAAIEKLRVQVTALVDQGSQIFSKALLDAAAVLSAQQRQTLVQHLQEMHGQHHQHGF